MIRPPLRSYSPVVAIALASMTACAAGKSKPAETVQTTGGTIPNAPVPGMILSTSEILGIVREQAKADLDEAKLATSKASDARVRALAEEVVRDETAREDAASRMMTDLGIAKPTETMIGVHVKEVQIKRLQQLRVLSGASFDRTWVEGVIDNDRSVIQTYDKDLIPSARNPIVKEDLERWRARAERRLAEAEHLRAVLAR